MPIHHKMPYYYLKSDILIKIVAFRYFQYPHVSEEDKEGWFGDVGYSKYFLGGWIK